MDSSRRSAVRLSAESSITRPSAKATLGAAVPRPVTSALCQKSGFVSSLFGSTLAESRRVSGAAATWLEKATAAVFASPGGPAASARATRSFSDQLSYSSLVRPDGRSNRYTRYRNVAARTHAGVPASSTAKRSSSRWSRSIASSA